MAVPYETIAQAVADVEREARGLPSMTSPHVCQYCFGPKGAEYDQCYGCLRFLRTGEDSSLSKRVLPVSIAEHRP